MNKFTKFAKTIDIFFLEPVQRFSHWSQKILGPTNFGWARFCIVLFLALNSLIYGLYCYQAMYENDPTFSVWSIMTIVLMFALGGLSWVLCSAAEYNCEDDLRRGMGNSLADILLELRLLFLVWAIFFNVKIVTMFIAIIVISDVDGKLVLIAIGICLSIGFLVSLPCAFFYLISCTPLPPCKNKAMAKLKKLKEKVSEFLLPQPDATPAS